MNWANLRIKLLCIIALLLTLSCDRSNNIIYYETFPIQRKATPKVEHWIDLNSGYEMAVFKNVLAIRDIYNENLLYFYNLPSQTFIGSFGKRGKGPNEFVSRPWLYKSFHEVDGDILFYLTDQGKRETYLVRLYATLATGIMEIVKTYKLPKNVGSSILQVVNDSIMVGRVNKETESLIVFNANIDSIVYKHPRLKLKNKLSSDVMIRLTSENLELSPNHEWIVGTFNFIERINLYSKDGELQRVIMSKESKEINFSLDGSSDRLGSQKRYFIASIPSDKYILIVNAKTTFTGELPNTEILIFDYSGKAIAKYELDRFVYSYAMDWENFRLFCYDDFEDAFLSYDFWELEK